VTGDNYPAGVSDASFDIGDFAECCVCKQDNVAWTSDGWNFENECADCGSPICDECFRKCPEDDAGDKVCEECAR